MSSADFLNACSRDCLSIPHTARTKHQLCIKGNFFISWLKPTLKLVSTIFCQISIFQLFTFLRYLNFCIFVFSSFFPCQPLL